MNQRSIQGQLLISPHLPEGRDGNGRLFASDLQYLSAHLGLLDDSWRTLDDYPTTLDEGQTLAVFRLVHVVGGDHGRWIVQNDDLRLVDSVQASANFFCMPPDR